MAARAEHRLGDQGDLGAALTGQVDQAGVAGRGPLGGQQPLGDVAGSSAPDPLGALQQEATVRARAGGCAPPAPRGCWDW